MHDHQDSGSRVCGNPLVLYLKDLSRCPNILGVYFTLNLRQVTLGLGEEGLT